VRELARVTNGSEPWLLESSDQMALIRRLEKQFPSLEEVGCKVGIGVATGADKAYIGDFDKLDVEPDRKLPLVTTKDILSGEVQWHGQGVINPFVEGGGLVELRSYPRLRRYLEARREVIAGRHCAQKSPANWYRTIDRIIPALASRPKLLIPDIKGEAHIVFECGELYPHHNLYYVTSDEWDLRACFQTSHVYSCQPTQPKCAADISGFRRNTCVAFASRNGRMSRHCCGQSWRKLQQSGIFKPATAQHLNYLNLATKNDPPLDAMEDKCPLILSITNKRQMRP